MTLQSMSTRKIKQLLEESREWLKELHGSVPTTLRQVGARKVRVRAVAGLITRCEAELNQRRGGVA